MGMLSSDEADWCPLATLPHDVLKDGGAWLGTVRERIKSRFRNGDQVEFGSQDKLTPEISVHELELMCAAAVAADRRDNRWRWR